ncbi:MAG: UrcA family protein [Sphingomonadales bacterium]|nr:UrcA family protein [Sphingomonadales bacterium]
MKTIATALVAACLLAVPTGASARDREPVSVRVSTQGVDFANPRSVDAFRTRMASAIAEVCNPGDRIGADMMPDFKCRREMTGKASPEITRMAAAASHRAYATNDAAD